MERNPISDAAKQFLLDAIGSVERLDILLWMQKHADRWWTAKAISDELRIPAEMVESNLGLLGARNLISVRIAQDVLYRFVPGTRELQQLVDDVVRAHYADRGAVAAVVASPVSESARLFADAFRLRKGTRDG